MAKYPLNVGSIPARDLLVGDPFGEVYPPRPLPDPPPQDARTLALESLRTYLSEIFFLRRNAEGLPPFRYRIPASQIFIDATNWNDECPLPAIVVLPRTATYESLGLGTPLIESTHNVYGTGTALQDQSEYTEPMVLEIWAAQPPERQGILAVLERLMMPTEAMAGLRLRVPGYYDQTATFEWMTRVNVDDEMTHRNRMRAQIVVQLRIHLVSLVNVELMTVQPSVEAGEDVDPDELG